ncbi:hypothetical protein HY025_04485 [Candidatus Daviesbacteria bacterium]|nr:hypothetical protein [Candidatus Daviesbacteria bacterium]
MSRKRVRKKAHKVAGQLKVSLPGGNLPLEIKLIALFTITGGLSIMGGIFGDVVRPNEIHLPTYFARLIVGILMITISYGIVSRKRWSLWLYGLVVICGLLVNFVAALIPLIAVIYLFFRKDLFTN